MRKKKEKQPIVLSNQELMPSVLGIMNGKDKSNWPIVIFFIFLILFVVFLPDITSYITGEKTISFTPSTEEGKKPSNTEPSEELIFYDFKDNLMIEIDGMVVNKFIIDREILSLTIANVSEAKNYLVEHPLFLELYDSNQMLLQRIKMPNENISKGTSETYSFTLSVPTASISQVLLVEKTVEDYPSVNLTKEDDATYSLVCSNEVEKITYLFNTQGKLFYITDVVNYEITNINYQTLLIDYRELSSKYNSLEGVTSNIVEVGRGFTSTTTIDLEKVDLTNKSIKNTLDNLAYYEKDTEGKVVHFELSARNYQCK